MLQPDTIPKTEPLLRVGIVLPEDKQKTIILDTESSIKAKVYLDGNEIQLEHKLVVFDIADDKINFNGRVVDRIEFIQDNNDSFITVKSVIAGRGFHWAKHIEVKLSFKLEFSVTDGSLLVVNEIPIEEYLACVATSEMSAECPDSYIEAQTIVARSWMLANVEQKHTYLGFDVCNDDCCQRFQGVNNLTPHSKKAADNTKGEVLIYNNEIVDARYSKSCGGVMERFENLWENTPKDYMLNKSDAPNEFDVDLTIENNFKSWIDSIPKSFCSPHYIKEDELHKYLGHVDEQSKYFRWTIETTQEELINNIKAKIDIDIISVLDLKIIKRAGSGRVLELEIRYKDSSDNNKTLIIYKDYEVRKVLHKMFLYSSAMTIDPIFDNDLAYPSKFIFKGAGWGHGAGLCQIGGIGMSLSGYKTEEIVKHYYPGANLKKIYQ